jgi:trehalose 6-phosphate synthase
MAAHTQNQRKLIIASNRLPLSDNPKHGGYEATTSSGGLVTALKGLSYSDYLWLGWPGVEINERDRGSVDEALAKENAAAVYLEENLAQNHYNRFSSKWPTFSVLFTTLLTRYN